MMGTHSLSLKSSHSNTLKSLLTKSQTPKWSKLHFLGGDCACSENIYLSLLKRGPEKDLNEKVFIIGLNMLWEKKLKEKGYIVTSGTMDYFAKNFSITAVPQLSIFDERQNLIYSGGYTSKRSPSSESQDQQIVKELRKNHSANERPIFGCINGIKNRNQSDPFGIKY